MKCPKCESENTQRLEVAFHSGTQNISTSSNTAGMGIGSGGRIGFGGGVTKTSGQSQSVLAATCAPPAKQSLKWPTIGMGIGALLLVNSNWQVAPILIGLVIVSISGYLRYTRLQFNSKEWPNIYQHWAASWICHKCGGIYHQAT